MLKLQQEEDAIIEFVCNQYHLEFLFSDNRHEREQKILEITKWSRNRFSSKSRSGLKLELLTKATGVTFKEKRGIAAKDGTKRHRSLRMYARRWEI